MVSLFSVLAAGAAVSMTVACGADTATQERRPDTPTQAVALSKGAAPVSVPQNPVDRSIRRDLNLAIAGDADLRHREISFIVINGDVNVTGTVRTEEERRKINELAMSIGGVKSVANGLRVAE